MTDKVSPLKRAFIVETALLKAMAVRENYEFYYTYVIHERLLPETQTLLEGYKEYYALYQDHKTIDFETYLTQFCSNWHRTDMTKEDIDLFSDAILRLKNDASIDSESALIGLINKQFLDTVNKIGESKFDSERVREELDKYDIKRSGIMKDQDMDCFTSDNVDFTSIDKSKGIPYALEPLQDALGGMVPGSLVVLNAASGIGKSAFIHTQCVHTFKWLNKEKRDTPILFFNTEGPLSEVFGRFWSNLYQDQIQEGYTQIVRCQDKLQANFEKKYNKKLFMAFAANDMGINFIRTKIKKYNPCLVILDMAPAIMTSSSKGTNEAGDLKTFFNSLRRLSSENCPILATVQAGAGAKWWDKDLQKYLYKQWPTDDDIYGSKTAVQGASETIITIGRDNEHPMTRYIQTTKKKALQSAKFICELEEKYSNYRLVDVLRGQT